MEVNNKNISVKIEENKYEITASGKVWKSEKESIGEIVLNNGRSIAFNSAKSKTSEIIESEISVGILTRYRDLKGVNFAFDTFVYIDKTTNDVCFEWIPVNDYGFDIKEILWPSSLKIEKEEGFTLFPYKEGIILNHKDENPFKKQVKVYSEEASLCWCAQSEDNAAYLMISETPWDQGFMINKAQDIEVSSVLYPSLGKMEYKRILRYKFIDTANIDEVCTAYKQYSDETNRTSQMLGEANFESISISTFSYRECLQEADGTIVKTKLCPTKEKDYLKLLCEEKEEIYLKDFYTTLEECNNPSHRISRKQCIEEKRKVLKYLNHLNKKVSLDLILECFIDLPVYKQNAEKEENESLLVKVYKQK